MQSVEQITVRVLPDGRITRRDAALYVGLSEKTLAMRQLNGLGPRSVKVGGRRFYYLEVLDAFIRGDAGPTEAA